MKYWIIEYTNPDHPNDHFYFIGGHTTSPEWSSDIKKSIKFFSKDDSDRMINWRFNNKSVKSKEIEWPMN